MTTYDDWKCTDPRDGEHDPQCNRCGDNKGTISYDEATGEEVCHACLEAEEAARYCGSCHGTGEGHPGADTRCGACKGSGLAPVVDAPLPPLRRAVVAAPVLADDDELPF
jgi:hypothetical protein